MILSVQFQRLGHQYTMLCSVSNINATHDECQGILNCYILYNWYIMHSQKLLCTISWIRSLGIRHCQGGNGPAKFFFRFYLTGAWQTFSGRFTTFLANKWILSCAIFTDSIITTSADCMGGPYEKELLKGLLTDYERYYGIPLASLPNEPKDHCEKAVFTDFTFQTFLIPGKTGLCWTSLPLLCSHLESPFNRSSMWWVWEAPENILTDLTLFQDEKNQLLITCLWLNLVRRFFW